MGSTASGGENVGHRSVGDTSGRRKTTGGVLIRIEADGGLRNARRLHAQHDSNSLHSVVVSRFCALQPLALSSDPLFYQPDPLFNVFCVVRSSLCPPLCQCAENSVRYRNQHSACIGASGRGLPLWLGSVLITFAGGVL
jgi:hypothetical protein